MANLPLDLTGSLAGNKITGETRSISRDADRFFVPNNGAIFDHNGSFKVFNAQNGVRLQPNTQYRLLHLVESAVKITNKNVYAVIYIIDKTITSVRYDYQAVGGVYENIASVISDNLSEYLYNTTGSNTIGSVVGVPLQVPPEHHLQSINDFQGAGALLNVLEGIRKAFIMGNGPAFSSAYEYIDYRYQQAHAANVLAYEQVAQRQALLEERSQIKNGDYIVTTVEANPATYLGYGNWVLDSNALLYGSADGSDVGTYVDVGAGTGHVAIKRFFWRRDDAADGISYTLTSSASAVNEGGSVTINLTSVGIAPGTAIAYRITGISENDIIATPLTGNFIVDGNGNATMVLNVRADMETEGIEVIRVSLSAMPTVFVDISIADTSIAAAYTLRFTANANGVGEVSSVNEGSKVYLVIQATGVTPGTRLYLLYNDSTVANEDTIAAGWPSTVTIPDNGMVIVEYEVKADQLTEGAETLVVNVCTTTSISSRQARSVITVNDTSRTPTANITFSASTTGGNPIGTTNEGTTVYAFVSTTNINNGEFVDITYSGTGGMADFSNTLPSRVVVQNNQAIITLTVAADVTTEGDETLNITALYNSVKVAEKTIVIRDTSVNPSFNLKFSTNTSGTDAISRVNEGGAVYLYLETTNIPDGTTMPLVYTGSVDPSQDLVNYPRSLTITGNRASGLITVNADQRSEGEESLVVEVRHNGTGIGTAMLYINDTSASPTANIRFSTTASGGNTITQTNEGTVVYAIIETTNINNGTVLNITHGGSATADDFITTRATAVTINNNVGVVELQIKNDLLSEGQETYRLTAVLANGEQVSSTELKIVDSSVPTLNVYFSNVANGSGQVTTANEGDTVYLVIETSGIATGVSGVGISYSGTTEQTDVENYGLTNVTISGSRTIVPYKFINDNRADGEKSMSVSVTVPGINDPKQTTITVNDTSKFSRLTASGNIVVPPGKTARVILLSGTGMADYDNDGVFVDVVSSMKVDGTDLFLKAGDNGTALEFYRDSGAIYGVYDGRDGAITVDLRGKNVPVNLLNRNEHLTAPPDIDGIVQLITVMNRGGNDDGFCKMFNMPGIPPAISEIIEEMGKPVAAPQQSFDIGNGPATVVRPGYGAGSPAIVMIYQNKGTEARTIPVTLMNRPAPTVSGIRGHDATCFYEIFDNVSQANLHYRPGIVHTNYGDTDMDFDEVDLIQPGEAYLLTLVSGGGASKEAHSGGAPARGQDVTIWWNQRGGPDNLVIQGGTANIGGVNSRGSPGRPVPNGALSSYAVQLGSATIDAYDFTILTGTAEGEARDHDSPIYGSSAGFVIVPWRRQFVALPWTTEKVMFGAPGYPRAGGGGGGGSGHAATFLIRNTTQTPISLYMRLGPYYGGGSVNPQMGKPGAIILSRVFLTGQGTIIGGDGARNMIYPDPARGVDDSGYSVIRGYNVADEYFRQNGRYPNVTDNVVVNIPAGVALIGNNESPSGITFDARLKLAASLTVVNQGLIAGLGGHGGGRYQASGWGNNAITNSAENKQVNVTNSGTIAGGGGGGGSIGWGYGGGGGAPYGKGGPANRSDGTGVGQNGSLLNGGFGGWDDRLAYGGALGSNGSDGPSGGDNSGGGLSGLVVNGNVTINNLSTGVTRGR